MEFEAHVILGDVGPQGDLVTQEEAHRRAVEDYSQYAQYARMSAQLTFGVNGGASAAMLSFLTALVTSDNAHTGNTLSGVIHDFGLAAGFYLGGLFLSILAVFVLCIAKRLWGDAWEHAAFHGAMEFEGKEALRAKYLEWVGGLFLVVSASLFVPGSYFAVHGFIFGPAHQPAHPPHVLSVSNGLQ